MEVSVKMDVIHPLKSQSEIMTEAHNFTKLTNQREICKLASEVANALVWNPRCIELIKLQQLLSKALNELYCGNDWFPNFSTELSKLS